MEKKAISAMPSVEDVIACIEDEPVFAVFEDLTNKHYSIISWGYRNIVSGSDKDAVGILKNAIKRSRPRAPFNIFPGGLLGYVSYDAVRLWEDVKDLKPAVEEWPYIEFFEPENIIVYDHSKGLAYINGDDSAVLKCTKRKGDSFKVYFYDSSLDGEKFERAVEEVLGYIEKGYAFQVVISRFQRYTYKGDLLYAYTNLRRINPSPYTYFIKLGDRALIGASPELLFSYVDRVVETYPIAGTRRRGHTPEEDESLERELIASEKDRAEHLMLVDLARNDVGKVAVPGTVKVEKLMYIEKYSHVQHLVSRVTALARKKYDAVEVLRALLPAGTVSGAPKPFAMNLIEELEEYKRGPYAGGVGLFTLSGNAVMAIAIRTAFVYKDTIRIQAGAGVVYDSKPRLELEETEHKLAALKTALGIS